MARSLMAAFVCISLLASMVAVSSAYGEGTELGTFPDRVFSINARPLNADGVSYVSTFTPDESGIWWVELTELKGSYVLVQVYIGQSTHGKPLSSTDLRNEGDQSKGTYVSMGGSYTVAFTCFGKKAAAVLDEHFELGVPDQYIPHAPIFIHGDGQFTPENGVVGGDGTSGSPFVIAGWEIDASSGVNGIEMEWTTAYFVIRDCCIHSAPTRYHGIYLYFAARGVVENCVLSENWAGLFAFLSSPITVTGNVFDHNVMEGCTLNGCDDSFFTNNFVETDHMPMAQDFTLSLLGCERVTVQGNTFVDVGIDFYGNTMEEFSSHTITDNTVGGLPIQFISGMSDVSVVNQQYGQLIVVCSTNVQVSDMVMGGYEPMYMAYVEDATIERCEFAGVTMTALELYRCSNILVRDNSIHDSPGPTTELVFVDQSPSVTLFGNTITNVLNMVLKFGVESDSAAIIGNKFFNCGGGVILFSNSNAVVAENEMHVRGEGVTLAGTSGTVIRDNTIEGAFRGIFVDDTSTSTRVYYNNMISNVEQATDRGSGSTAWDDGTSCGNYWSDYTGVDANGDGIGDVPYVISDTSRDNFPMMQPFVT